MLFNPQTPNSKLQTLNYFSYLCGQMRCLRLLYLFLPSAIFLLTIGCSPLKGLKDDELILKRNVVRSVDDSVSVSGYVDYIQQKPKGGLFSRRHAILDTALVTASMHNLQQMMENKGYLNAVIDTAMYIHKRRATVAYVISPHHQYQVRNAWYDVADPYIPHKFNSTDGDCQEKPGFRRFGNGE